MESALPGGDAARLVLLDVNGARHTEDLVQGLVADQRVFARRQRHEFQIGGLPWWHHQFLDERCLYGAFPRRQAPS